MEIEHAFIQQEHKGKLEIEEKLVSEELEIRGIPISYYSSKFIRRRSLPLSVSSLVVGDIACMYGAIKQLNIPIPQANSYPIELIDHLHRNVKQCSLSDVESSFLYGRRNHSVFIKPAKTQKKFTGLVLESAQDLARLSGVSRSIDVWCSDVVKWLSEWRVYVVNNKFRCMAWYEGDQSLAPDTKRICNAISLLGETKCYPRSYAIDFGVLSSGETALIEMNDGFAIGAYELSAKDYTDMVIDRWLELLSGIKS